MGKRGCGRESSVRICLGGEGSRARKEREEEEGRREKRATLEDVSGQEGHHACMHGAYFRLPETVS